MRNLVFTLSIFSWISASGQSTEWDVYVVASGGAKPVLALSSTGAPGIAYMYEAGQGWVDYAAWNEIDQQFDISRVASGYFYGPAALTIDSDDIPHIVYHDHTSQDQAHAVLTGQGWFVEQIRDLGHDGWDNSVIVDRIGVVHTSSVDPFGSVEYAYSTPGSWIVERIGSAGINYGYSTSIALDSNLTPHIAYHDDQTGDLMLASRTLGWNIVAVDTAGNVGRFASMVIDSAGATHISYYRDIGGGSGLVEYARRDDDGWTFSTIEKIDNVSPNAARNLTSLDLDSRGRPHVAYSTKTVVRYAYYDGSSWVRETVTDVEGTGVQLGQLTSLKLDNTQTAHVAYYALAGGGLVASEARYARRKSAASVNVETDGPRRDGMVINVYPNPIGRSGTISITLSEPADISGVLYDVRGRVVRRLLGGRRSAGKHFMPFKASTLSRGRYFLTVIANGQRVSTSVVLLGR
jgi:hypothetical protein